MCARDATLAALSLAGCTPSLTAHSPTATPPSLAASPGSSPAAAQPPSAAAPSDASDLVIGSERGLEIWNTEGKLKRLVAAGPALHPRWLDAGSVLIVVPAELGTLSQGAELQRITLADGQRTSLARLPGFSCSPKTKAPDTDAPETDEPAGEYRIDLQDEGDFVLDPARGAACLRLQDRNDNMADLALSVRVNLATHEVERRLEAGAEYCPRPPEDVQVRTEEDEPVLPTERVDWCVQSALGQSAVPKQDDAHPFGMGDEGTVRKRTPKGWQNVLHIPGYGAESASPSGRWLVLGGDQSDGDYIHRSLVLLDRDHGQVYPIVMGRWPEPLQPRGKAHPTLTTPIEDTVDVVGESEVRWLGTPESEVLIIDGTLLRPGVGLFEFNGRLAR